MLVAVKCFDRGNLIRLTAVFTDENGEPIDPTTVTVWTVDPSLDALFKVYGIDVEVVKDDVGKYHYFADASESGDWKFGWEGTGQGQSAGEGKFKINTSARPTGSP